ncbi:unnamed protein product [Closterium sp. NIES-65]|nr:unnamed protein product [Closterium sp. NIES-65]
MQATAIFWCSCSSVRSFGVVMLVVITAHKAVHMAGDIQINLKQWVAPLVASGDVAAFKNPHLDAPGDLLLRLARLALTCMAMPTASRPTMGRVLGDLLGMKEEVGVLRRTELHAALTERLAAQRLTQWTLMPSWLVWSRWELRAVHLVMHDVL